MAEKNIDTPATPLTIPVSAEKTAWSQNSPLKKDGVFYANERIRLQETFSGNEFLTITEAFEEVKPRTISLLTSDVRTHKLVGVSREGMEEA